MPDASDAEAHESRAPGPSLCEACGSSTGTLQAVYVDGQSALPLSVSLSLQGDRWVASTPGEGARQDVIFDLPAAAVRWLPD